MRSITGWFKLKMDFGGSRWVGGGRRGVVMEGQVDIQLITVRSPMS